VNTGTDHAASLARRRERCRHQRPDRRENDGRIEGFRRELVRASGPDDAQLPRQLLRGFIAGPCQCKYPAALGVRHLGKQVGRGSETVQTEAGCIAGGTIGAIADQAGAEQRRGLHIGITLRDRQAIASIGHGVLRKAALESVSGECRPIAEILRSCRAIPALPAGPAQPWHADTIALAKTRHAPARLNHAPDDFVARRDGIPDIRQLVIHQVQIRPANTAGENLEQHLCFRRLR
jgi:hypothetical protein